MGVQIVKAPGAAMAIELLNCSAMVSRRNTDEDDPDFVLVFEDARDRVTVYVPMSPQSFREWVEALHANLSPVVLPAKVRVAGPNGKPL